MEAQCGQKERSWLANTVNVEWSLFSLTRDPKLGGWLVHRPDNSSLTGLIIYSRYYCFDTIAYIA